MGGAAPGATHRPGGTLDVSVGGGAVPILGLALGGPAVGVGVVASRPLVVWCPGPPLGSSWGGLLSVAGVGRGYGPARAVS